MDINQEWKKVEERKDEELSALLDMTVITTLPSKDPIQKLRSAILLNAGWGLLIAGGYLYVLLRWAFWEILICVGFIVLVTLWGVAKTLILYRKLTQPSASDVVLGEMEWHYNNIRQWMKLQQWAGLSIYPVSVAGGFLLGGSIGSGMPIDQFLQKPGMLTILLITLVILVPVSFYLAKRMSYKAFGQYAGQLKANIDSLKREG